MSYDGPERRSYDGRIAKIEYELEALVHLLEEDTKNRNEFRTRIEDLMGSHTTAIYGDNFGVGLNSRVKTLEEAHKNHQGNIRVIWIAVIGVVISSAWKAFISIVK